MAGALHLFSLCNIIISLADHDSVSQLCRHWKLPSLPDSLEWEHVHCASRDALVHCANGLPFTLARRAISIDGSGGKDGAPASRAAIALANDGHLQF